MRRQPGGRPGYAISNPTLLSVLAVSVALTVLVPVRFLPHGAWPVVLGVALMVVGIGLRMTAWTIMRRLGTDPDPLGAASKLVTGGPFRFTRNPVYLGIVIVLSGGAVASGSVWLLAFAAFGFVAAGIQIRLEERYLAATFGDEFDRYRRRVRRWL